MRILWLNVGLLLPLDKGGKLRTWHLMRHLATRHEITYLSFRDPDQPAADLAGMREVCAHLVTLPRRDTPKRSLTFYAEAAGYLAHPYPYAVAKYRSRAYAQRVADVLETRPFDLVVCDFLPPVVNLPPRLPCAAVLFTHNVEAEIWRRHAETAAGLAQRTLMSTQWRRMRRFEAGALRRFGLVLAVSDADRRTFQRLYAPASPIAVVPTGVDTRYFQPPPDSSFDEKHLVFTGSMDWLPNEDSMTYFCREILPIVRRVEPDVTLSIVGRAPTPTVRKLADIRGVEVTGSVDDVRPHIARGAVYVVPLRVGGGTRLKIFEAMSMGRACVSTTVGAEGLPVTPGEHLLVADEPERFAHAIVRLLRDRVHRAGIERAARRLVVERYDWTAAAAELEEALNAAARRNDGATQTGALQAIA
ncbi:MAG TPA: glycosyltransferase [Vicinamibacterales bacterium]|jgi:sugar transferase (PEP-CTERM/EpsH1 system associated)|nr:glycosyltransferase [Vicinamibacterales bacterium]